MKCDFSGLRTVSSEHLEPNNIGIFYNRAMEWFFCKTKIQEWNLILAVWYQVKQLKKATWKKFRLKRDSNPWPCDTSAMLYPLSYWATELLSYLSWYHTARIQFHSYFIRSSHIWFSYIHIHIFHYHRVYHELTIDHLSMWLGSSVERALHRYRKDGFESRSSLNFFQVAFFNCLSWYHTAMIKFHSCFISSSHIWFSYIHIHRNPVYIYVVGIYLYFTRSWFLPIPTFQGNSFCELNKLAENRNSFVLF